MSTPVPAGDLARCVSHEMSDEWPTIIEIVAYFSSDGSRKGKRRFIQIEADQFFGRNGHGAPLTGDQLLSMIDRLRRQK